MDFVESYISCLVDDLKCINPDNVNKIVELIVDAKGFLKEVKILLK